MDNHPTVYYLRQLIGCTITDVRKVEKISGMPNHDTHVFTFTDTEGVARELYLDAAYYGKLNFLFKEAASLKERNNFWECRPLAELSREELVDALLTMGTLYRETLLRKDLTRG